MEPDFLPEAEESEPYTEKNWRDGALCAQIGGDLWFPEKGQRNQAITARENCGKCEVAQFCLDYAVRNPSIQHGIWGGQPPREIRRLRQEAGLAGAELNDDMEAEDESIYDV